MSERGEEDKRKKGRVGEESRREERGEENVYCQDHCRLANPQQ